MTCTNPRCVRLREALERLRWRDIEWALGSLQDAWEVADHADMDNLAEDIGDALRHLDTVRTLIAAIRLDRADEIGERARAARTTNNEQRATPVPS
ncbi:MAG TPA: hypothetical protein VMW48_06485 [Vicinamibacterales bacterium]|nr:hypothetical protein [Armatimonadota bacterium]HUU33692.1 hypothetical protein [Vicinamibacterales bacterium]